MVVLEMNVKAMHAGVLDLLARIRRKISDTYWEQRFGVATETPEPAAGPDSRVYVTLPYRAIFAILRRLALGSSDTLIEIGCGKGRVLLAAMQFPVAAIVGIELSRKLADIARKNVEKQRRSSPPVQIINQPAQEADLRRGNVFYLYNPFGPDSFRAFLRRLEQGLHDAPRDVRIAYVRTYHDDVFREFDWLEKIEEYQLLSWVNVSVWRNVVPDLRHAESPRSHAAFPAAVPSTDNAAQTS